MNAHRHVDVADGARQVGEEDRRALEHTDEDHAVGMVGGDLGGQSLDGLGDGGFVEQGLRRLDRRGDRHSLPLSAPWAPGRSAHVRDSAGRPQRRRGLGEGLADPLAGRSVLRSCRPSEASSPSSSCRRARASGRAGARTAAGPGRTAPLRGRRSSGTCAGGGPRCRGRRTRPDAHDLERLVVEPGGAVDLTCWREACRALELARPTCRRRPRRRRARHACSWRRHPARRAASSSAVVDREGAAVERGRTARWDEVRAPLHASPNVQLAATARAPSPPRARRRRPSTGVAPAGRVIVRLVDRLEAGGPRRPAALRRAAP